MKRKKLGLIILCFIMLFSFNAYAKKPSKSSAKKAYKKYIAKTLSKLPGKGGSEAFYLDMNNDGVVELFYCYKRSDVRPHWRVCIYKKGKVKEAGDLFGFLKYNKKKKRIVLFPRAAIGSVETVYKLSGSKLEMVVDYRSYDNNGSHYLKNGKEISSKQYQKETSQFTNWNSLPENNNDAKIKLNKKNVTLTVGKKAQLKIEGTDKKVSWSSSNKRIASVSKKGTVLAKKAGKATITAKVGKKKHKCVVTVKMKTTTKDITTVYKGKVTQLLNQFDCFFLFACIDSWKTNYNVFYRSNMLMCKFGWNYKLHDKTISQAKKILKSKMKLYFGKTDVRFKKYSIDKCWRNIPSPSYMYQMKDGSIFGCYQSVEDKAKGFVEKIIKNKKNYNVTYNVYGYPVSYDFLSESLSRKLIGTFQITLRKVNNRNGFIINDIKRVKGYIKI